MSSTMTFSSRDERSYMMPSSSSSGGLQSSRLGFVAKQDMPNHISILFRAR